MTTDQTTDDQAAVDAVPARGRRTILYVSVAVGVVILVLVGVLATRDTGDRSADSPLLGELVPPVAGETMTGEAYDIDDHQGQWVVVNFFAQWCVPCRLEHPELVAFSEEHAASGDASIVSIAFDDEAADIEEFFSEEGGDWPVLTTGTGRIAVDFGVTGVPESYLVAPDGTVVAKWISGVRAADIDATIAEFEEAAGS
jgi:cytochrome c biogenesis protein CcmG/thiol:disulfide interchange protein DsbE